MNNIKKYSEIEENIIDLVSIGAEEGEPICSKIFSESLKFALLNEEEKN